MNVYTDPSRPTSNFSSVKPLGTVGSHVYTQPSSSHLLPAQHQGAIKHFDQYDMQSSWQPRTDSQHIWVPSLPPDIQKNNSCPHCLEGSTSFRIPSDPTNTMYCSNCRQPFHLCPIHRRVIGGPGYRPDDVESRKCQCQLGQSFLSQDRWDQCFN